MEEASSSTPSGDKKAKGPFIDGKKIGLPDGWYYEQRPRNNVKYIAKIGQLPVPAHLLDRSKPNFKCNNRCFSFVQRMAHWKIERKLLSNWKNYDMVTKEDRSVTSGSAVASVDESMEKEFDELLYSFCERANLLDIYLASKRTKTVELMEEGNEKRVATPEADMEDAVAVAPPAIRLLNKKHILTLIRTSRMYI